MQNHGRLFLIAVFILSGSRAVAGQSALLELSTGNKAYRGRLMAFDNRNCWLLSRDGRLKQLDINRLSSPRTVAPRFEPFGHAEMRDRLRREFGTDYEVAGAGNYLVCASGDRAREYARLFDGIYRRFNVYFSRRGFQVEEPEFPLVAVVFPDFRRFAEYARAEGVSATPGLKGYYLPSSNRVALYDTGDSPPTATRGSTSSTRSFRQFVNPGPNDALRSQQPLPWSVVASLTNNRRMDSRSSSGVEASLRDTIIHETTHQVAFNTGLHSRIGENPKWVVEGLAMVFESPGVRHPSRSSSARSRMNRERYIHFGNYAAKRRKQNSLAAFVSSDAAFRRALDGYAEAWALTFYLLETRPRQYAGFLAKIAERDPLEPYRAKQRLADFTDAFGDDFEMLEASYLRFISELE